MKITVKYHDTYQRMFRNAVRECPNIVSKAMTYTMNGLLSYVKGTKFGGDPLYSRSDKLKNSLQVETRFSGDNVFGVLGTDLGWIETHERGAIIYPKSAPYLRFPLYERGSGAFLGWKTMDSVTIPQRPVIGSTIKERRSWVREILEHRLKVELSRSVLAQTHGKRFGWGV